MKRNQTTVKTNKRINDLPTKRLQGNRKTKNSGQKLSENRRLSQTCLWLSTNSPTSTNKAIEAIS